MQLNNLFCKCIISISTLFWKKKKKIGKVYWRVDLTENPQSVNKLTSHCICISFHMRRGYLHSLKSTAAKNNNNKKTASLFLKVTDYVIVWQKKEEKK